MKIIYILTILLLTNIIYAKKTIDIDLSKQKLYAKENGKIVFSGSISSGKSDHPTPRGTFKILEKERFHISNKYPEPKGGAKMPYMHRLTRYGVAIHQGYLPGYPASHGCIRVSKKTAKRLWSWSRVGIKVRVFGNASNFKYVKKKKKRSKKRYTKRKSRAIKPIKHYAKRRVYKPIKVKRQRKNAYEIIELYDSW